MTPNFDGPELRTKFSFSKVILVLILIVGSMSSISCYLFDLGGSDYEYDDSADFDGSSFSSLNAKPGLVENPVTFTDEVNNKFLTHKWVGKYDEVIELCDAAIEKEENLISAYYHKGLAHMLMKQRPYFKKYCKQALEYTPENAEEYFIRGNIFLVFSYTEKALKNYTKAIELDEGFDKAYANRGFIYIYFYEDYDKAIVEFTKAIELSPDTADYYANRSEANVKFAHRTKKQTYWDLRRADLDSARKLDHNYDKRKSQDYQPEFPNSDYTSTFSMFGLTPEYKYPDDSMLSIEPTNKYGSDFLKITKDGESVYSVSMAIQKWNIMTGQQLQEYHAQKSTVDYMDLSPDESLLVTTSPGLKLWSTLEGERKDSCEYYSKKSGNHYARAAVFTPDGKSVVVLDNDSVRMFSVDGLEEERVIEMRADNELRHLTFNNAGTILAATGYEKTIKLWSTDTWKPIKEIRDLTDYAGIITFSPDDNLLAVGLKSGEVIVFEMNPLSVRFNFFAHDQYAHALAFSPDSKLLATGGSIHYDGRSTKKPSVKIWSMDSGELLHKFYGHTLNVDSLVFHPDGKLLISGGGANRDTWSSSIKIWLLDDMNKDYFK